jgi:hypothetical protein
MSIEEFPSILAFQNLMSANENPKKKIKEIKKKIKTKKLEITGRMFLILLFASGSAAVSILFSTICIHAVVALVGAETSVFSIAGLMSSLKKLKKCKKECKECEEIMGDILKQKSPLIQSVK